MATTSACCCYNPAPYWLYGNWGHACSFKRDISEGRLSSARCVSLQAPWYSQFNQKDWKLLEKMHALPPSWINPYAYTYMPLPGRECCKKEEEPLSQPWWVNYALWRQGMNSRIGYYPYMQPYYWQWSPSYDDIRVEKLLAEMRQKKRLEEEEAHRARALAEEASKRSLQHECKLRCDIRNGCWDLGSCIDQQPANERRLQPAIKLPKESPRPFYNDPIERPSCPFQDNIRRGIIDSGSCICGK